MPGLLPRLLLGSMQAAASRRQRQRIAAVASLGVIGCAALLTAFMLFGWALFLAYGALMLPAWAALAAGATLIGMIVFLGIVVTLVWRYRPSHGLQDDMEKLRRQIEPLAREHPLAAIGTAAGLGVLMISLLRR
ncbi:hypothetical protein [Ferrovibrio sp.]|uniref:hypothetical protein n=1 Tax=Ferrovibrio sp. TaxID=1917215 RepID=UPI0026324FB7|nr:hypothetical protein [Ferrovibrio sp.]